MGSYVYNMKERINISINTEVAKAMRAKAIETYGSLRAFSQLIEDLYTHRNQVREDPGLTPAELAVLDMEPDTTYLSSMKSPGTSCCGIWDRFYECPDCDIKFEMFGSNRAPVVCPQCESRRLMMDKH